MNVCSKRKLFEKQTLLKNYFYKKNYKNSNVNLDSIDGNIIVLIGLSFVYDNDREVYRLVDKDYDAIELICIAEGIFRYMISVKDKGLC